MASSTSRIRRKPAPIWVEPEAIQVDVVAEVTTTLEISPSPVLLQCQGVQRPMYALSVYNGSDKSLLAEEATTTPVAAPIIPPRNPRRKTVAPVPAAAALAVPQTPTTLSSGPLLSPNASKILKGFGRLVKKAAGLPDSQRDVASPTTIQTFIEMTASLTKEDPSVYQLPILPSMLGRPIANSDTWYSDSWEELDILVGPASEPTQPSAANAPPRMQVRSASVSSLTDAYIPEELEEDDHDHDHDHHDDDDFDLDAKLLQFITSNSHVRTSTRNSTRLLMARPISSASYPSSLSSSIISMTENTSLSSGSLSISPRSVSPSSPALLSSAAIFDNGFGAEALDDSAFESWFSCDNEKPSLALAKVKSSRPGHSRAPSLTAVPIYRPLFNPLDFDS